MVQDRAQERLDAKAASSISGDVLRPVLRKITMKNVRLKWVGSD
jgi:hypothetical protein